MLEKEQNNNSKKKEEKVLIKVKVAINKTGNKI